MAKREIKWIALFSKESIGSLIYPTKNRLSQVFPRSFDFNCLKQLIGQGLWDTLHDESSVNSITVVFYAHAYLSFRRLFAFNRCTRHAWDFLGWQSPWFWWLISRCNLSISLLHTFTQYTSRNVHSDKHICILYITLAFQTYLKRAYIHLTFGHVYFYVLHHEVKQCDVIYLCKKKFPQSVILGSEQPYRWFFFIFWERLSCLIPLSSGKS